MGWGMGIGNNVAGTSGDGDSWEKKHASHTALMSHAALYLKPTYIFYSIALNIPPRSLGSSNKNLLIVPDIQSELDRRSFHFAAPTTWNYLPQHSLFRFIICFPWITQDLLISKVSSAIVINSLHNSSSDCDLRYESFFCKSNNNKLVL